MANPRQFSTGSPLEPTTAIPLVWQELETAARTLPMEKVPEFLGALEKIRILAFARLVAPAPDLRTDELVGIEEASRRLNISKSYLYRHSGQFPFTRHIGRKLAFSSLGIDRYIMSRR
jgi:predicted DNA-binding transcriptional regulator AlpA